MLTTILIGVIALLVVGLGYACFQLWKFAKIILVFEDDLGETLEALGDVNSAINGVLEMSLFYDSPEVRKTVQGVLDEVKLCRAVVNKVIHKFTERSKQRYIITTWDELSYEEEEFPVLPGQPSGTPNPLETIRREGTVADVRHQKRR